MAAFTSQAAAGQPYRAANTGVGHGRACPGHPRLGGKKAVDARDKPGHDEKIA
jgi:hypothetical protein